MGKQTLFFTTEERRFYLSFSCLTHCCSCLLLSVYLSLISASLSPLCCLPGMACGGEGLALPQCHLHTLLLSVMCMKRGMCAGSSLHERWRRGRRGGRGAGDHRHCCCCAWALWRGRRGRRQGHGCLLGCTPLPLSWLAVCPA